VSAAIVPGRALAPLAVMPTFLRCPLFGPLTTTGRKSQSRFQFVDFLPAS